MLAIKRRRHLPDEPLFLSCWPFQNEATSEDDLHFEIDPGFRVDPSQFSDGDSGAPNQYTRDKVHWVDGDEAVVGDDGRIRLYFLQASVSVFVWGFQMTASSSTTTNK